MTWQHRLRRSLLHRPCHGREGADLRKVKQAFNKKVAVVGGVSNAVTWSRARPRRSARPCSTPSGSSGPDGFVLYAG